ncbi:hypothetical protein Tco_0937962 [Tanacetum coccineum]|uniref:Uncharacterized protein n=1 Tax=Tanacetum coccineum TaxID=301880 RepID=A0ABQ5DGG7_9ASTR
MSKGSYPSQSPNVFPRLRHEESVPSRQRNPVSITVFIRLGEREKNIFTRLGEGEKGVFSRLGPENMSRRRHANARRDASAGRATRYLDRRKRKARNLVRSYVTCSSERHREIEREWDAANQGDHRKSKQNEER